MMQPVLHPQVRAILDRQLLEAAPDITKDLRSARSYSHCAPDLTGLIDKSVGINHRYFTSPSADIPLNIYTPEGIGPFAGMVYFHGGGWVQFYPNKYDAQLTALSALTHSVIVAPNYQKAPEHKFPVPFDDCYAALEWTYAHSRELNINSSKIGVAGDSAGGNLASAVTLKARDEDKFPLTYQLLIYPCNGPDYVAHEEIPYAVGFGTNQRGMKWAWEQYLSNPLDKYNPYAAPHSETNFAGLPPTIIVTAEFDVLREDGLGYAQKLLDAGVDMKLKDVAGMIHGFFNYGKYLAEGIEIRKYVAEEINRIHS